MRNLEENQKSNISKNGVNSPGALSLRLGFKQGLIFLKLLKFLKLILD